MKIIKNKTVIYYESSLKEGYRSISPAKNFIPDWYRENKFKHLKKCLPFLDAFLSGYIITLPYDVHVKYNNGKMGVFLEDGSIYNDSSRTTENENIVPFNHNESEFMWDLCASIKIPEGCSILFTHPLNRHDLPFTTISSIIHGEVALIPHGSIPFYIKNGFEGVIKSGTPIAQIIPFKQESWKSEVEIGLCEYAKEYRRSNPIDWYKKKTRKRKSYD
jgi:hypothetical protein